MWHLGPPVHQTPVYEPASRRVTEPPFPPTLKMVLKLNTVFHNVCVLAFLCERSRHFHTLHSRILEKLCSIGGHNSTQWRMSYCSIRLLCAALIVASLFAIIIQSRLDPLLYELFHLLRCPTHETLRVARSSLIGSKYGSALTRSIRSFSRPSCLTWWAAW